MKELQFYFPRPGKWDEFTLTAVFPDMAGFVQNQRYRHRELTPEQLQAFSEVVSALTVLADEWKAVQAWARLDMCMTGTSTEGSEDMVKTVEAVTLTVEAVNGRGARKLFTNANYPEFTIPEAGAVAFFKHFTDSRQ